MPGSADHSRERRRHSKSGLERSGACRGGRYRGRQSGALLTKMKTKKEEQNVRLEDLEILERRLVLRQHLARLQLLLLLLRE